MVSIQSVFIVVELYKAEQGFAIKSDGDVVSGEANPQRISQCSTLSQTPSPLNSKPHARFINLAIGQKAHSLKPHEAISLCVGWAACSQA